MEGSTFKHAPKILLPNISVESTIKCAFKYGHMKCMCSEREMGGDKLNCA